MKLTFNIFELLQKITLSIPSSFHLETVSPSLYSELLDSDPSSINSTAPPNNSHLIKIRDTSNDKNNSSAGGYVYNNAKQIRLDGNAGHNCSHSSSNNNLGNKINPVNSTNSTDNGTRTDNREVVEILPNHRDVEPIKLVENGTFAKPIRVSEQNGTKSDLAKLILNESTASDGGRKENVTITAVPKVTNSTSNAPLARQEATTESGGENGTKSAGSDSIEIIKSISVEYPESIGTGRKFGPYGEPSFGNFGAVSSSSFSKNTHHRGSTVSKIIDLTNEGDVGFGQQYDSLYSFGEGFGLKNAEVKTEKRRKPSRKPPRSEKQSASVKVESSKKSRGRGRSKKSQSEKLKVPSVSASDINSMLFWNDSPSGRRLTANDDAIVESTDWDGNRFSFDVAVGDE